MAITQMVFFCQSKKGVFKETTCPKDRLDGFWLGLCSTLRGDSATQHTYPVGQSRCEVPGARFKPRRDYFDKLKCHIIGD